MHRRHAQSVYDAVLLEYNNSICGSLSTVMHPHKSFLFGMNLSLIHTDDGSVTYDPSKMTEVFIYSFSE